MTIRATGTGVQPAELHAECFMLWHREMYELSGGSFEYASQHGLPASQAATA